MATTTATRSPGRKAGSLMVADEAEVRRTSPRRPRPPHLPTTKTGYRGGGRRLVWRVQNFGGTPGASPLPTPTTGTAGEDTRSPEALNRAGLLGVRGG